MPFGISSAPEEFQRREHEITEGLQGVYVIGDDILVYGCGDTKAEAIVDHDKNLFNLFTRARGRIVPSVLAPFGPSATSSVENS